MYRILTVLSSLCAEGTPVLALGLARVWRSYGVHVEIATIHDHPLDMLPEYQADGLPIRQLRVSASGYRQYWDLAREAYRACREVRPDVLLAFPFGWHSFLGYGARAAGVRRIVAHAGNYPPAAHRAACRKLAVTVQLGAPLSAQVICCSDYVRRGIHQELRVPERWLHTVYNGIPLAKYQNGKRRDTKAGGVRTVRCGMVARLEPHKDQPALIRAARLLRDRGLDVKVELAGDGSRRNEFERLIGQERLEDRVSLPGVCRDVPSLLSNMDLFVFSVTPDEGLGVALIEAMAAGVPVIASDVGACREVLCPEGEDPLGELVPAGSPEAIANAVERFVQNREAWEARAARARESAGRRFSIEAMAQGYLQIMGLA